MLDLFLGQSAPRRCDGFSRRDFLRLGAVGALGITLPGILRAQELETAQRKARARSVILVYLGGGLSHHDSFDPKPEAPPEIRGVYKSIDTSVSGLQIGELLPRMAQAMNRLTLVRSGAHNNDHHETATNWALSGRFGSAFGDFPAIGAVVSHELGFRTQLPPYVSIPRNPSFTWELGKSAFLGGRFESFKTGDPNDANFRVPDVAPAEALAPERVDRRKTLREAMDSLTGEAQNSDQLATFDEFHQRAASIILSAKARRAFAIERESDRLRDRYGRNSFGQSCLLARRLVEGGVRFVTINYGGWDHHAKIFEGLNKKLPEFDLGFSALIQDLEERGLLDETMVVAFGEFGRSPKINKDTGRDHWGPAASLLFAGAGIGRGQVVGQTDKQGAYATRRPVAPADVAWTIYDAVGIDPTHHLHTADGRPVEILDKGETIKELYV
jgi:hypothetical protein